MIQLALACQPMVPWQPPMFSWMHSSQFGALRAKPDNRLAHLRPSADPNELGELASLLSREAPWHDK